MSAEYSVEEVRAHAAILRDWRNGFDPGVGNDDAADMLTAYAERINADEGAVPVGYTQMTIGGYAVATLHASALNLPDGTKLFARPLAQAAQVGVPAHREWRSALTLAAETLEVEAEHMAEGGQDGEAIRMKRSASIIRGMLGAPTAEPVAQGDVMTWTNEDKSRAFEWLRAVATTDGAPDEAGIAFDTWHALATASPAPPALPRAVPDDKSRLDLLQDEIVDTIYMDDGRIIDVRGLDVRKAIDEFAAAPSPGESA